MTDRATIQEVVQIGIEGTAGTQAVANKQLLSTSIMARPAGGATMFRPSGYKFATVQAVGKDFTEADIEGVANYNDLAYLFAGLIRYAGTPTLSSGTAPAGTAYTWTFAPQSTAEDTVKTFTVEMGSSVRAHRFEYGLINGLEISFDREAVNVRGDMIGTRITDGITLTSTPTAVAQTPILPNQVDVFLDTASGSLGSTKLTRVFSGSFRYGERFRPIWPVNSANASFAAHVEGEPAAEIRLMVEADSTGMGLLNTYRGGSTQFVRIRAQGGTIHAGASTAVYSLTIDAAVKVSEPYTYSDEDGVYAAEFTLRPVHDATWGKAFTIALVNTQTFT